MEISFVWFDIGYTLVYMQREITYQQALKQLGQEISIEDIEKGFHLTDKLFMRDYQGFFMQPREVFMPAYLGIMNHRLGLSVNVCELNACWEELKQDVPKYWLPFRGAREVLEKLKRRSVGLGVISNWDATARDVLTSAGLIDFFDHLIISCEVNCCKPDPQIFNLALETASVEARQCLYVGDNYYDDCIGCRQVGMKALIINRFGSLGVEEISDCPLIGHLGEILEYI